MDRIKIENYIPDIVAVEGNNVGIGYARFLLETSICPECKRVMVARPSPKEFINFDAQIKAADFCVKSKDSIYPICEDCASKEKVWFTCELCVTKKGTDKIKKSIGDPPVFLCTDCFGSVTAKEWQETVDDLLDDHQWDWD